MKKRELSFRQKRAVSGLLFISPWLIGFIGFFLTKFIKTIVFSFNKLKTLPEGGYELISNGFENYRYALMGDPDFNRVLTESVVDILIDIPIIIFFSLFIAILLNRKFAGRGAVRAIFFLPVILASPAIVTAMDSVMRSMMGGISNVPAEVTELSTFNTTFITDIFIDYGFPPSIIDYIVAVVDRVYDIIRRSGVQIVIFLAALQSINPSLYEVCSIEGATSYESFWKVTFPMVSPLILTNVIYTIIDTYSSSEVVNLAYTTAFSQMNFGLSAAMSMITTAVMGLVLIVIGGLISRKVFYQN